MPTRKFRGLVKAMPAERQRRIANRVRQSLMSMPLEEIRKARQMTQAKLADE
jgi:transcriptional regulator with XRE-family HTH domain